MRNEGRGTKNSKKRSSNPNPEGWDEQVAMKPGNGAQLVFQMYLKVTPENEGAFGVGKRNIRGTPTLR